MSKRKAIFAINWMEVDALVQGIHNNPHHILGMHECIDDLYQCISAGGKGCECH